jgi:hypothetical protein
MSQLFEEVISSQGEEMRQAPTFSGHFVQKLTPDERRHASSAPSLAILGKNYLMVGVGLASVSPKRRRQASKDGDRKSPGNSQGRTLSSLQISHNPASRPAKPQKSKKEAPFSAAELNEKGLVKV